MKQLLLFIFLPLVMQAQEWNAGTDSASGAVYNYPETTFLVRTFLAKDGGVDDTLELISKLPYIRTDEPNIAAIDSLWGTISFTTSATKDTVYHEHNLFIWQDYMPRVIEIRPYNYYTNTQLKLRTNGRFDATQTSSAKRKPKDYLLISGNKRGK